jgi:hypothetical protein
MVPDPDAADDTAFEHFAANVPVFRLIAALSALKSEEFGIRSGFSAGENLRQILDAHTNEE